MPKEDGMSKETIGVGLPAADNAPPPCLPAALAAYDAT
jgi:hypothetical protein